MTSLMPIAIFITACAVLVSCKSPVTERHTVTLEKWSNDSWSAALQTKIQEIEQGSPSAWVKFSGYDDGHLDGVNAATYCVACSELLWRNPTLLLEKHLQGDPAALRVARRAHSWMAKEDQKIIFQAYNSKLRELDASHSNRARQYVAAVKVSTQ